MKVGPDYNFPIENMPEELETSITEKMNFMLSEATKEIESYQFGGAAHRIYDFVWHDLADKYLEETKNKEDQITKDTLAVVLISTLGVLHPFMPFVTEEIYSKLPADKKKLLMIKRWPML